MSNLEFELFNVIPFLASSLSYLDYMRRSWKSTCLNYFLSLIFGIFLYLSMKWTTTTRILPTENGNSTMENLRNSSGSIPCLLYCIEKTYFIERNLLLSFSLASLTNIDVMHHLHWIILFGLQLSIFIISFDLHISDLERGLLISAFYIVDLISCIHMSFDLHILDLEDDFLFQPFTL